MRILLPAIPSEALARAGTATLRWLARFDPFGLYGPGVTR